MPTNTGFKILASGMSAQRTRINLIASNLANAHTTRTEEGGAYKRQDPVFEAAPVEGGEGLAGVDVAEVQTDDSEGPIVFDPEHPDADAAGNVELSNVNTVEEMVNMVSASRSFESNVTAFQTLRDMALRALEIGR